MIIEYVDPSGYGITDHGLLSGLADDDHAQYLLADGTRALTGNWDAGDFTIRADDFIIEDWLLGTPTYTSVADWSNLTQSAGLTSGLDVTDGGGGTVDIAAGTAIFKTTDSVIGANVFADYAGTTGLALVDEDTNWIYLDYNAGTPTAGATTDYTTLDLHTKIIIAKVFRSGTTVTIVDTCQCLYDLARKVMHENYELGGFKRATGLVLSTSGLYVQTTAGVAWEALSRHAIPALDTDPGGGADTFTSWYVTAGTWTKTAGQTQFDVTQYNDTTTGLATLSAARYGVHWVYVDHDGGLHLQYGQGNYILSNAQAAAVPTPPTFLSEFAVLVGKIIFLKSAASAYSTESAFTSLFVGAAPSDHGSLAGLSDDDHTGYLLLAGRSGGQTGYGGTAASETLTLAGTSHATAGAVNLNPSGGGVALFGSAASGVTPTFAISGFRAGDSLRDWTASMGTLAAKTYSVYSGGVLQYAHTVNSTNSSVWIGNDAGNSSGYAGTQVFAIGPNAAKNRTGNGVLCVGSRAGEHTSANASGDFICLGASAGRAVAGVGSAVLIGSNTALLSSDATESIAIGSNALRQTASTSPERAVGIGYGALYKGGGGNQQQYSVGIGYLAGSGSSAKNCLYIHYQAGLNNTTAGEIFIQNQNLNAIPWLQGNFTTGTVHIGSGAGSGYTPVLQISGYPAGESLQSVTMGHEAGSDGIFLFSGATDVTAFKFDQPVSIVADLLVTAGNIVVSGTVDGRDVAADGTILDGLLSNCFAFTAMRG